MRKILHLILGVFLLSQITVAQNNCTEFSWAKNAGSGNIDYSNSIVTDSQGNNYITGKFDGTAIFGNITVTSNGVANAFIAKLDTNGNFIWVTNVEGNSSGQGISIDSQGNSYIVGSFSGTANFGTTALTSSGYFDIFISKLDANGSFSWTQKAGGNDNDQGIAIATDNQGNCYATGYFRGSAAFGNTNLLCYGNQDAFVVKLDSQGNFIWVAQTQTGSGVQNNDADPQSIAIDNNGNSYITGSFGGTTSFGNTALSAPKMSATLFIAKLDNQGNFIWAKKTGPNGKGIGYSIASNSNGDCYVTGSFSESDIFGNTTLTNNGSSDIFIMNLDANGNYLWAKSVGSNGADAGHGISCDSLGNSYVIGEFKGVISFGNTALTSNGASDIFITKLDINGDYLWAKNAGGNGNDNGTDIDIDNQGNCYITGNFSNAAHFGNSAVSSNGSADVFIAKISKLLPSVSAINDQTISCGDGVTLPGNVTNYSSFSWSPTTGLDNPNSLTPTANPTQTTTYTLTATNDCGVSASESVTVFVNVPFSVITSATQTTINCGASTQLKANVSGSITNPSYSWTPSIDLDDPTAQMPVATPSGTTTYSVTVTNDEGCGTLDSITIFVDSIHPSSINVISNTGSFKLCDDGLTLSAPGFVSYEWSNENGVVGLSSDLYISQPGVYTVLVYNDLGCAGTKSVTVEPLAEITTPDGTVLCPNKPNQKVKLVATAGMTSYQWSTGQNTPSIKVNTPGFYTVTVTKGNCSYTMSVEVTESDGQAYADFSHLQNGLTVQFEVISPSVSSVSWNFGDGSPTNTSMNPTHTYPQAGTYEVTVTVKDACGYTASETKSITVSGSTSLTKEEKNTLKIYPNPASNNITIENETNIEQIHLRDLNGRIITSKVVNGKKTVLEIEQLNRGIYLIEVWSGNGKIVEKIVKK